MVRKLAILLSLLAISSCLPSFGYPQAGSGTTGSFVNGSSGSLNAAAAQAALDYQGQQAEALAAARAKAAKEAAQQAAKEAKLNEAIRTATNERDGKLLVLKADNDLTMAGLHSKADDLNTRIKALKNDAHGGQEKQISDLESQYISIQTEIVKATDAYNKKVLAAQAECDTKIAHIRQEFATKDKRDAEAKTRALQDKALKYNQEQADKGNPVGLLRMGERYRDGEGVPKDLDKAKTYLQKAAEAGSPTASDELKKLTDASAAQ